jgi:hypothetical protein
MRKADVFIHDVHAGVLEEIALPVKGKKSKLDGRILIDYFGRDRLGLQPKVIASVIDNIEKALPVCSKFYSLR